MANYYRVRAQDVRTLAAMAKLLGLQQPSADATIKLMYGLVEQVTPDLKSLQKNKTQIVRTLAKSKPLIRRLQKAITQGA